MAGKKHAHTLAVQMQNGITALEKFDTLIKWHMHLPYDTEIPHLYRGVKWEFMFKSKPINKLYIIFIHNHQKMAAIMICFLNAWAKKLTHSYNESLNSSMRRNELLITHSARVTLKTLCWKNKPVPSAVSCMAPFYTLQLLIHFHRVRLCMTLWTAAHQAAVCGIL